RDARVRVRARVHEHAVGVAGERVHGVDELTLAVVLHATHRDAQLRADFGEARLHVDERRAPVAVWLAATQQVQVRAVEDDDLHESRSPLSHALKSARSSTSGVADGVGAGVSGPALCDAFGALSARAMRPATRGSSGTASARNAPLHASA